jgi:hypothetical protein
MLCMEPLCVRMMLFPLALRKVICIVVWSYDAVSLFYLELCVKLSLSIYLPQPHSALLPLCV